MAGAISAAAVCGLLVIGCVGGSQSVMPPSPTTEPWPAATSLATIQQLIEQRAGILLTSVGQGRNVVEVSLRSGGAARAREILDAYGPAVHIQVGFLEFPSGKLMGQPCAPTWHIVARTDVRATLELASTRIVSGDWFRATVRLTTLAGRTIALDSGQPLIVYLFRPGSMTPVGSYEGAIAGTGLTTLVMPSQPASIAALGSTASCVEDLGYALPPGSYEARALVEDGTLENSSTFWSDPLAVEVVAAP